MKRILTVAAVLLSIYGSAQTKGTTALSLGIDLSTTKSTDHAVPEANSNKTSTSYYSFGYGYFFKDNAKIGIDLLFNEAKNEYSGSEGKTSMKTYGAAVNYQQYYPLIGKFYAFAGGNIEYSREKTEYITNNPYSRNSKGDQYALGANAGIIWFLNKRWAFEATLLSANASYSKEKTDEVNSASGYTTKQTDFKLKTEGIISNLGFKIYLLF